MKKRRLILALLAALPAFGQSVSSGRAVYSGAAVFGTSSAPTVASIPTFSPVAGTYSSTQSVTISTATSGCGSYIYWSTTDNSPTTSDTHGTSVTVSATETVYAKVIGCPSYIDSAVGSAAYTITSGSFDGPAELPRVTVPSAMSGTPARGSVITVNSGGNLQTALNNAVCGNTIKLQAGATFTGPFTVPAKSCDINHWIIIETSAYSSLPAEGTRITPCYAGVASLPGRPSYSCSSPSSTMAQVNMATSGYGPFILSTGANYYRFIGLEVTRTGAATGDGILFGNNGTGGTADHIIVDRCWFHGQANDETYRGIDLNGMTNMAVIDSYFNDFKCITVSGSCTDAQALAGGYSNTQDGPYKIQDNFLEAAAENILFGGGSATKTPADIQILSNHFFKPLTWQPGTIATITESGTTATMTVYTGQYSTGGAPASFAPGQTFWITHSSVAGYDGQWTIATVSGPTVTFTATTGLGSATGGYAVVVGGPTGNPFMVKNNFELKNGIRVQFEGNLLENSWGGFSQNGYNILLTPKNQGGGCPLCIVEDVTIRYSKASHSGGGIQIAAVPDDGGQIATGEARISIHDIVLDDISYGNYNGDGRVFEIMNGWPANALNSLTINHVTAFADSTHGGLIYLGNSYYATNPMYGFIFTNNIMTTGPYPVWSTGGCGDCAVSDVPVTAITTCFTTSTFNYNALFTNTSNYPPTSWPSGNLFPATTTAVGFVNFSNGNGGNYLLQSGSPYKNAGTDGKDLGADITAVNAALANVE